MRHPFPPADADPRTPFGAEILQRPTRVGKFLSVDGKALSVRGVTYGTFRPRLDGAEYPGPAVMERDVAAIAAAVRDPSAMENTAQKLRARVAASFSVDAMVDQVLAGYQEAIQRKPSLGRALVVQA